MTWEDGVGFNLYIDGELDEPTLAMQNTAGTTALMDRFVLGDGAKAYWDGYIDEVAVEVNRRSAGTPRFAPVNAGLLGHFLKLKIVFLEKQTVLVRAVDQKKIRPAVPVEVADADPTADKSGTVEPA